MSSDADIRIPSLVARRWARSAELGNRDIVVGMAGQTIGRTDGNFDRLAGNTPVETIVSRDGGRVLPMTHRCGDEWSG
jgi:hypothetical protein